MFCPDNRSAWRSRVAFVDRKFNCCLRCHINQSASEFDQSESIGKFDCLSDKYAPDDDEDAQPFKDTAMFWHSIWLSAGRPLNTELHIIMKKTISLSDKEK